MTYYICSYADYTDLPDKLFCEHSPNGHERKSTDETKFITRCSTHAPEADCLSWMNDTEPSYTHAEILLELQKPEWSEE